MGLQKTLQIGNLDSERDWGHAKDYVEAMWLMLQHTQPDDYVIGTGEKYKVRHFLEATAKELGMNIHSNGNMTKTDQLAVEAIAVGLIISFSRPSVLNRLELFLHNTDC